MATIKKKTIPFLFSEKHKAYIRQCENNTYNIAEGAVRAGKTVDNVFAFAHELKTTKDKIHLATGSTQSNAKLNIGDANGFGLEAIFRGQCNWGKYKGNECLYIKGPATRGRQRVVIFAGGAKEDSYKKIRGNSYGMWIATEINLHHDNTIKEAFNRCLAADRRKIFWDLNPDNPNAKIYTDYIDKYAKLNKEGRLLGGYNYEHFTIDDNINISDERREEIKSQYDPASIWYQRDILGKRSVAEGLIYERFASLKEQFLLPDSMRDAAGNIKNLRRINVGLDFGGSGSGHAFVATGIIGNYQSVVGLCSERHFGDIDPDQLGQLFVDFLLKVINKYGAVHRVYCDNAEQVLIRGIKKAVMQAGIRTIVGDAQKNEIVDRIRLTSRLIGQGRLWYTEDCDTFVMAMATACWNPKKPTITERLDDGTSDIDTLDAFEYTIERDANKYIRVA